MKKYLLLSLTIILSILTLSSCGNDNEEEKSSNSIKKTLVGVWKTSMESSNWRYVYIRPNGVLYYDNNSPEFYEKYDFKWDNTKGEFIYVGNEPDKFLPTATPDGKANWAYDESTQSISMYRDDGYYAYTYKVVMSDDSNSWAGVDKNGKTFSFVRLY